MPDNRRNPNNQDNDDLSSTISGFSRSLDNLSQSLKDAADDFEESVKKLNRGLGDLSDDLDDHNDNNNQNVTDARDIFSAFTKNNNKNLNTFQTITKGFVNAIGSVFDYFIGQFKDSINRLESTFNSSISDIAARMDLTYSQYQNLYTSTSDRLARDNLNAQFSVTKYINNLQSVLETGLRGQVATDLAYSNLITGRLLPSLNTISTEYRRFYKMFGDQFSESITAIGRYTEEVYGAEHIEQGNLDAILQSLQVPLTYAASTRGLSMEEQAEYVQDAMSRIVSTAGILSNTYNIDPTEFYQLIADAIANPAGSSQLRTSLGIGSSQLAQEVLTNENAFFTYLQNYLNTGYDYSSTPDYISQMTSILGRDQITALQIATAQNQYGGLEGLISDLRDDLSSYDAATVYSNEEEKLQNNQYISVQEKISNQIDNILDDLAVITVGIPNLWTFLGNITSAIGGVAGDFLGSFLGSKLGGGGSLLGGSSTGGTSFIKGAGGASLATVGSAIAIAAGSLMAIDDASEAYDNSGGDLASAVQGFLTGETFDETELEHVRRNEGIFDWSEVGSNALKWGLIGGGAGTLVTPGIGTAIGGIGGAVTGALSSIIGQYDRYRAANEYAESELGKLADSISETTDTLDEMQASITAYNDLREKEEDLISSINKAKGTEKDLLEQQLDLLRLEIQMQEALLPTAKDLVTEMDMLREEYSTGKSQSDFLSELYTLDRTALRNMDLENNAIEDMSLDQILNSMGMTNEQAESLVSKAISANYIKEGTSTEDALKALLIDYASSEGYIVSANAKGSDYDDVKVLGDAAYYSLDRDEGKAVISSTKTALSELTSKSSEALSTLRDYASSDTTPDNSLIQRAIAQWERGYVSEDIPYSKVDDLLDAAGFSDAQISSYKKYVQENGIATSERAKGFYKVGLYDVPSDNYLANLHSGEMVLTSTNADKLRQLASGGITGVLDTLTSLTATTSTEDSSAVNTTYDLIDAIDNQTTTLVSELDTIYDLIYKYFTSSRSSRSSVSTIPENVVNMSGY